MRIAKFGLDVQNLWTSQVETSGPLQQNAVIFPPALGQESQLEFHCWSSETHLGSRGIGLAWWDTTSFLKPKQSKTCHGKVHHLFFQIWVLRIRSVDASSIPGGIRRNLPAVSPRWNPKQPEDVTEIHPVLLFWGWEQGRKDLGKLYIIPTQIT